MKYSYFVEFQDFTMVHVFKSSSFGSEVKFLTLKMGEIAGPETLGFNLNHTPGNYPNEDNLNIHTFYSFQNIITLNQKD